MMKNKLEYVWPVIGLAAVVFSVYLLSKELKGVEVGQVWQAVVDRGPVMILLAFASTTLAYAALAWYDRIALMHVGKKLSWPVVSIVLTEPPPPEPSIMRISGTRYWLA